MLYWKAETEGLYMDQVFRSCSSLLLPSIMREYGNHISLVQENVTIQNSKKNSFY